jgi:hypothetical protein
MEPQYITGIRDIQQKMGCNVDSSYESIASAGINQAFLSIGMGYAFVPRRAYG